MDFNEVNEIWVPTDIEQRLVLVHLLKGGRLQ